MYPIVTPKTLAEATTHIRRHDAMLAAVIDRIGACTIAPHHNYYQALVESIIGQQLSVKAAHSIRVRFIALFGDDFPHPKQIIAKSTDELRSAGLSGAKVRYVTDLTQRVLDGRLQFDYFDTLGDADIVRDLTAVIGIGEWTAHMFLMFCMGRLDVLPIGDLGIRNGVQKLYNLPTIPAPAQVRDIANQHHWHPYATVASWYIWASLDNKPN